MRHKATWTAVCLLLSVLASLSIDVRAVSAHGYTENPKSRGRWCQLGEAKDCGGIQWEPQSTEGPKGFPEAGPADGHLCSAGHDRFAQVDAPTQPNGAAWPVTTLEMHSTVTLRWYLTAPHSTTSFVYYVTKDGWDSTKPLSRVAFDLEPFYVDDSWSGVVPAREVVHENVHVPHRNGHHVVLAVWTIDDTANAFYSCADVYIS